MEDTGGKQTYPSAPPAYSEAVNDSSGAYNNDNIAYYPPPTAPPAYNGPQQPTYYAPHQGQPLPQAAANSSLYQNRSTVVVVDQDAVSFLCCNGGDEVHCFCSLSY